MSFIDQIIARAKSDKKTIVIPESMDKRVLKAVEATLTQEIADIIVIGNIDEMKKIDNSIDYSNWNIIDPNKSDLTEVVQMHASSSKVGYLEHWDLTKLPFFAN